MLASQTTIAIVGGGISGIVQAKWLLYHKISSKIVLFEKASGFGGVWDISREHGVMDCTVCNVSKYVMELTHFPWPDGTINFPHHSDVLRYVQNYAEKFVSDGIVNCKFNCIVSSVEKISENKVLIEYLEQQKKKSLVVDHVVIASGHSTIPNYPIQEVVTLDFVSHSGSYKNSSKLGLVNKNVLVIGISFSGVDIAVDLVKEGMNNVTVLTRKGSWFAPKQDKNGSPSDIKLPRLFMYLPHYVQTFIIKQKLNRSYFNQDNWKVSNKCDPAGGSLVNSEEFVKLVMDDQISVIHGIIEEIHRDKCVKIKTISDGIIIQKFDHVIFCTGYEPSFDFLSKELKSVGFSTKNGFYPNLYLNMFPIDNPHLISYIGLVNTQFTSPFQIIDLQAQYISCKLSGKIHLPEKNLMKDVVEARNTILQVHYKTFRGSLFFPGDYQDVLAKALGKIPKLCFLKTPKLWIQFYFGPITWAGYHVHDLELHDSAKKTLDQTCDEVFGKNWFVKLQFVAAILFFILPTIFLSQVNLA